MALMLEIKVIPVSGKRQLGVDKNGQLKCFITRAPEKGKANKEVIEIVADRLGLKKRDLEIVSGFTSRKKLIKIYTEMSFEKILEILGSGVQSKLI